MVNGPGPCGRYSHTVTLVGSNLFVFGGFGPGTEGYLNDIWALDLNRCTFTSHFHEPFLLDILAVNSNPVWELYEPAPGDRKPPPRRSHVSVTTGDRIIVFVPLILALSPHCNVL